MPKHAARNPLTREHNLDLSLQQVWVHVRQGYPNPLGVHPVPLTLGAGGPCTPLSERKFSMKLKHLVASLLLLLLCLVLPAQAQAATVLFDTTATVAEANGWTSVLYVNNVAFPLVHTCALIGTTVTCTATVPAAALLTPPLTATGAQRFEVTFVDSVLGESPKSIPLFLTRPVAPINPRFR